MKYSHILAKQLSKYEISIRKISFDYKKWKKLIKYDSEFIATNWKKRLNYDCKRIDAFLFTKYPCLCNYNIDPYINKELCYINMNTLYKICKKLDKKLKINAMDYYNHILKKNKYKFTYMSHETLIENFDL